VLRGYGCPFAQLFGRLDACLRFARSLLCLVLELLGLPVCFLRGYARGLGSLVGQPPRLRQRLGRLLDEILGSPPGGLCIALGFLDLVIDFLHDFLPLLVGVRFGVSALALDELLGGPLSLSDALPNLPCCLALDFLDAGVTPLAHLVRVVGELLGRPRRLDCSFLGRASTLRGVTCAPHADRDGVANRCGVDHGGRDLPTLVTCARRDILECLSRLECPGEEPCGVRRHLP
jgi:hypothetical protein